MQIRNKLKALLLASAMILAGGALVERGTLTGVYTMECRDCHGNLKWQETFHNQVMQVGTNLLLDTGLAGAAYTVTGPYMFLVSSSSFSAYSAADTMASHAGWLEAGNAHTPTYSGNRKTCAWSAASGGAKSLSAALSFAITGTGTIQGAGIVYGSAAVNTIDSTLGTLFSAGTFSGGTRSVINGDTVNVSYTITLT